jgi:SEC-C motif-containing protein
MSLCPCGSQQHYQDCCQPFHTGASTAKTAEQLMRSRYSAFVKKLATYLLDTHQHSTDTRAQLAETFAHTQWTKLEIVSVEKGSEQDCEGRVEFIASYRSPEGTGQLHENSRFVKENSRWLYVDREMKHQPEGPDKQPAMEKIGRNDPCWCGSGKKSKKCHH